MKYIIIILSTLVCIVCLSCKNHKQEEISDKKETPKALEDKRSFEVISKSRGREDLVESLYKELVEKSPELKQLENKIALLEKSHGDSTEIFDLYNSKNQSYYSAAKNNTDLIQDSLLREKIRLLIESSTSNYNTTISTHINLIKETDTKTIKLQDFHTVLKITKTLPIIEKYQSKNKPSIKPLEGFNAEIDKTIKMADTLIKK